MNIKITSEKESLDIIRELAHVLNNLRYATKEWETKYGCEAKARKKRWEVRADAILNKLDPNHERLNKEINIVKS